MISKKCGNGKRMLVIGGIVIGMLLIVLVWVFIAAQFDRHSGHVTDSEEHISPAEFQQLVKHIKVREARRRRVQAGLAVDDPNLDPNNFPLPPKLREESNQVWRHLDASVMREIRIDRGLSVDDSNCDPNNFPLPKGWKDFPPVSEGDRN